MYNWKELSSTKKIIIGAIIVVAASFAPELMFLIDVGGIELAFSFILIFYRPIILWFKNIHNSIMQDLRIARTVILNSALAKPKILTVHLIYCTAFMLVTGILLYSFCFFLPALFISGTII